MSKNLQTKSVSVLPDRAGNVFKPQDVITFHISPNSVPVINPRETFLRFYCEITGNALANLDAAAAGSAIIETLQIYDGNNNTLLEEINDYAQYLSTHHHYHKTLGITNKRQLVEGESPNDSLNSVYFNMPSSAAELGSPLYRRVEICVPLYLSGVFYGNSFPSVATSGLIVRVYLTQAAKAIYAYSSTGYVDVAGQRFLNDAVVAAGATTAIDLSGATVAGELDATFANLPFQEGQTVNYKDTNGATQSAGTIIDIQEVGGKIKLSFSSFTVPVGGIAVGAAVWANRSSLSASYQLSNVELICGVIDPPKEYYSALQRKLNSNEGMELSIKSFNLYRNNVDSGQTATQVLIPTREARALSMVNTFVNPNFQLYTSSFKPELDTIQNYQYVLKDRNTPNRKVDVSRFNTANSWNATAIAELTKALDSAKVPVMSEDRNSSSFSIGRRLATEGYSCNIREHDVRLNLEFLNPTKNKIMNSNVYHIRRLNIRPNNVSIDF